MTLLTTSLVLVAGAQDISVMVNGEPVQFQGIGPQQINGRTMVPVRGVLEKLGADVSYNAATQVVTASTSKIDIQLTIGSKTAVVNTSNVLLDVPAQTINDHTFVPLRFLGEALGADVRWDAATRTVIIKTNDTGSRHDDGDDSRRRPHRDRTPQPIGPAPVINSFIQTSGKWLKGGEQLSATLGGTPGGQASFRIPGLAEDVPMREMAPGHYEGSWQAPVDKQVRLRSAAVIGTLVVGTQTAPLIQAGETVSVDTIPPVLRDLAPGDRANVSDPRPTISAAFEDDGSGIDRDKVRMEVNGRDVTANATVTRDFITYKPETPLPAGMTQIELTVTDVAGNRTRGRWAFVEQQRAEARIKTVLDDVSHVLQPGDVIHVEMTASQGGRAAFSTGSIRDVPMREVQPGHYRAEYTIRKGDDVVDKPIAFHLLMPDGQKFERTSVHIVRIDTGKPEPPVVVSPGQNAAVPNPLIVSGRAARNARVQVRVEYRSKVIGLVTIQGAVADLVVTADRNGNWQTEPINLGRTLGNRGVEYTITATAINSVGVTSEPTLVRLRAQ